MLDEWVTDSCDKAVLGGWGQQGLILAGGPGWLLEEKREEFDPGLKGESDPEHSTARQKSISRTEEKAEEVPRAGMAGGKRNHRAVPFPFYTICLDTHLGFRSVLEGGSWGLSLLLCTREVAPGSLKPLG